MESPEKQVGEVRQAPDPGAADSRGDYLGFVAHEVRNPLSTALWSAELLTRMSPEERGGARGEKLTAMCMRSLGRVRQLVEDHFLCERLDARGIPLRPEPLGLRALLAEVGARRSLDVSDAELDVAPELGVLGDRALTERALEGLLAAVAREGAKVRVQARREGQRIRIRVSGAPLEGRGLEDPRKGTQGDPRGRALALPLARRIAATLGGALAVDGDALVLSLEQAEPPAEAPEASP